MLPSFHIFGTNPISFDTLNIIVSGPVITLVNSFKAFGCLKVMNEWTEILDNGGIIDSVYMDFMKAFDKVPHKRLIKKMERYGINNKTINLVRNFLTDRKQKVSVNGAESISHDVTRGIPQGSVLGPILCDLHQ
jgi:hypothetical protein